MCAARSYAPGADVLLGPAKLARLHEVSAASAASTALATSGPALATTLRGVLLPFNAIPEPRAAVTLSLTAEATRMPAETAAMSQQAARLDPLSSPTATTSQVRNTTMTSHYRRPHHARALASHV